MTELPSSTVTLLFTDIEGSTELLKELGGDYERVLSDHRNLLRRAFNPSALVASLMRSSGGPR